MIVKLYALVWLVGISAAGIFYLTGNLTPVTQVVFGFLTFGAVFMGMLSVLPTVSSHQAHQEN